MDNLQQLIALREQLKQNNRAMKIFPAGSRNRNRWREIGRMVNNAILAESKNLIVIIIGG